MSFGGPAPSPPAKGSVSPCACAIALVSLPATGSSSALSPAMLASTHWALRKAWTSVGSLGAERPVKSDRSDRKSTRLNSSHANISYAVFCLKKKKKNKKKINQNKYKDKNTIY